MLDRLVRGAIFADTDTVVGKDPDRGVMRESRNAQSAAHIVREDEEGSAVGDDAAVDGHRIDDGTHRMFAHAKVEVTSNRRFYREGFVTVQPGFVGGG